MHVKRYLTQQNMRMVFKVLGLTIPREVREIMMDKGADFSDYFPGLVNSRVPNNYYTKTNLTFVEDRNIEEDEE